MSASRRRAAVFLDRDGVLNRTFVRDNVSHPPDSLDQLELLPGVVEATRRLVEADFVLVVVTNQPDVARGTQTRARVEEMNDYLRGVLPLLDVVTCYHDSGDGCHCRKPRPGMLCEAARRWGLDLPRSFMVGDRWSDVAAGQAAGCVSLLVDTPSSRDSGRERCYPTRCVRDLAEAADWIIHFSRRGVA
jgi:D-glycero-D-manno-heptose 1,7-bisphosphate phosphatase